MQEAVELYTFENKDVRTVIIDDEPWFVGKDVAAILGYVNTTNAVRKNVPAKYRGVSKMDTPSGAQSLTVISEPGLYKLIFKSHAPNAEKFTDWIAEDVLPTIRKHGMYATPVTIDSILADPDSGIRLLQTLKEERKQKEQALQKASEEHEQRLIAEQKVNEYEPKVSYYDTILQNSSLVTITQIAKDYGLSAVAMNKKLHELGVQFKQGKTWFLYAKYQKNGWTHSKTVPIKHGKGTAMQTEWTQKGRIGIYQILKENGILPLIEREDAE